MTPTSTSKVDSSREKITLQKTAPTHPTDPNEPGAPQAWYLPEHLGPTTPCCPTQHTRRTLQSLNQAMPLRSASSTTFAIRNSRRLYCSKLSIDLPTSTISACGNVALKAGSMENKVFLIDHTLGSREPGFCGTGLF